MLKFLNSLVIMFLYLLMNKLLGLYIYQKPFYCYGCLFYFNKIMLFHFNENLHELCLHLNIMYVSFILYSR